MNHKKSTSATITFIVLLTGCATSMAPSQFNESFPRATKAKFYGKVEATDAIKAEECKVLVENRKYTAPIAITLGGDVKNSASGVDEWVKIDKGNAYTINNFEWISVGNEGATQLIVHFNTLQCK